MILIGCVGLLLAAALCVWMTREIFIVSQYHQIRTVEVLCKMQAGMILAAIGVAFTLGLNFHVIIEAREQKIQELTKGKNVEREASQISVAPPSERDPGIVEVVTANGVTLAWDASTSTTHQSVLSRGGEPGHSGGGIRHSVPWPAIRSGGADRMSGVSGIAVREF